MFIECKEYWFDSIDRIYSKRKLAINIAHISSYFDFYHTEMRRTVVRVCLKTGRYHDIDASFDTFSDLIAKCTEIADRNR